MTKLVSAASITGLTAAADFHGLQSVPPAPTYDDLVAELRKTDKQAADRIVNNVPAGFELVPVFYSRIGQDENARVMAEYTFFVRPRFLQFLARDHADDLRALGICDIGIERMSRGVDPCNENGDMYDISIDHIIERSGSGLWGTTQVVDAQQGNKPPNFLPNHFNNLILLPDHIHQFKNELNDLQKATDCKPGTGRWVLMMVPVVDKNNKGYVCAPQPKGSKWHGIKTRPNNIQTRINQASYSLSLAKESLKQFSMIPEVGAFLKTAKEIAESRALAPVEIANDNNAINGQSLRKAFAAVCAKNPDAAYWDTRSSNAVKEVCDSLKKAYDLSMSQLKNRGYDREFRQFDDFFNSYAIRKLHESVKAYPTDGAIESDAWLKKMAQDIDSVRARVDSGAFRKR